MPSSQNLYIKPSSGGVTIGAPISGGNPGSVLFSDISNNVQDDGAFTYVSNNLSVPGDIRSTAGNVVLKQKTTLVGSAGVFTATFPEKSGTVAMTSDITGGVSVGAAISSGTASRVLFEGTSNLIAESANLTWDGFTFGVIGSFGLTGAQTTTIAALAATTSSGLTLQNTTAATSGAQAQYPPALYKLGHQWTNAADSIVGWRDKQTSSQSRGTQTIISDIDYTFDGTTFVNFIRNTVSSAGNGTMTVTGTLSVSNSIVSTTSVTAGTYLAGSGLIQTISTKTADYTTTVNDYTILADTSSGNVTITVLANSTGTIFNIKKISAANTLTIVPLTGTIDGAASVVVTANNQNTCVHSNGSNLFIL